MNKKFAESETKEEISAVMLQLVQETEDLAMKERESYSPILRKWHPTAAAVAALMLHNCYGHVLRQSLGEVNSLTSETVEVLHRAGKLEKVLVQMVVEDSVDCEDGGKTVVREMVPYEVDSIVLNLLKKWIEESLNKGKECIQKAKESEVSFCLVIKSPLRDMGIFKKLNRGFLYLNCDFCLYLVFFYFRHGIQSLNQSPTHNLLWS